MSVGEIIKNRRKQLKMSADDLAEKLGKNRATIYRYESSEIENMPIDIIEPLARALKVTPAYLMGWETEKDLPTPASDYPYLPKAISAGVPFNVDGLEEDDIERISIPDLLMGKWAGKDLVFTKVNGESMNKIIPDRSLIAVKPIAFENIKNGDIVVYSRGHDYAVKRYSLDGERIAFRPESTEKGFFDDVTDIYDEDLVIHGKVVVYFAELD